MNDRDCDNCAHHSDGGCSVWECSFTQKEDDTISRQAAVDAICGECQANCIPCESFPCGEIKAIQALPPAQPNLQPSCNQLATDYISRQAAIDALEKWESESTWDEWCYDHKDEAEKYSVISPSSVVFGLPSAKLDTQWIPCSERLPEEAYPVIVTWKNDDPASYYQFVLGKHYTGAAHYKNGKWFWYSSITEDVIMEYGRCDSEEFDEAIKVLAWMPLPEPYREEGD